MYYAESSIATIIVAVISIALSIYTSVKKRKSQQEQAAVSIEEEKEESPFFSIESVFKEIEEELQAAAQSEDIIDEEDASEVKTAPVSELDKMEMSENVVEEGIAVTLPKNVHSEKQKLSNISQEPSVKPEGLKERLKASPKDVVLYSEILKPKYKEF